MGVTFLLALALAYLSLDSAIAVCCSASSCLFHPCQVWASTSKEVRDKGSKYLFSLLPLINPFVTTPLVVSNLTNPKDVSMLMH